MIKRTINKDRYLCITVRKIEDDETDPAVEVFDEIDEDIYFDVSGYENGDEMLHSIVSLS